jgi:hypothetical protein
MSGMLEESIGWNGKSYLPLLRLDETRQRKHGAIGDAAQNSDEYQESE